jgi:hypothetical protein
MSGKWICIIFALAVPVLVGAAENERGRVIRPFNGKDLTGWKTRAQGENTNCWVVGKAKVAADPKALEVEAGGRELINHTEWGKSLDLYTEQKFGDCRVEVEVMVPQGSNSGIYLMGEYEVQVCDSFGREEIGQGDMGSIYSAATAAKNVSRKPGEWQRFVIDFRAPRFDAQGNKIANAMFVKVTLNGVVIHENVEVKGSTGGGLTGEEHPTGPLMLQGNHGAVAYRNLRIIPAR